MSWYLNNLYNFLNIIINSKAPRVTLSGDGELTDTTLPPTPIENIIIQPKYEAKISYHVIALIKVAEEL